MLIERGACPNLACKDGITPLMRAGMYVCMQVGMYVPPPPPFFFHVCMYVRMYAARNSDMDTVHSLLSHPNIHVDARYVCMYLCLHGSTTHVCMYVCMYVYRDIHGETALYKAAQAMTTAVEQLADTAGYVGR